MGSLNIAETDQLRDAFSRCASVASGLEELKATPPSQLDKEIDAMIASLKIAHDEIKTVWTMKGNYPA